MPSKAIEKFVKKYDEYPDDMFADTRMSLGEHIEELRYRMLNALKCLLVFLVIGFVLDAIGKSVGNDNIGIGMPMLDVITEPVKQQTRDFYYRQAERAAAAKLGQLVGAAPEEVARIRQKLKDNDNNYSVLTADERRTLLGVPEEMPVFLPTAALEPAFGARKDGAPDELAVTLKVYPGHISSLSARGEVLLESKNYLTTLSAQESMVVYFKVSILCGIVLSCPLIFYQFWAFVGAGLYPHEKRYVYLFFGPSIALFLAGVLLCQFVVLPGTVKALLKFNELLGFDPDIRLNEWLSLAIILPLVFGVSFQTPLFMVFLNRIGIFTAADYLTKWRYACIIIAFFAAIVTPTPDAVTMLYLFVPMFGLYMGGILICHLFPGFARAWSGMAPDPANPLVYLVGAGPGSPGLLTVRGAEVLARADLVLYDQLVPERLLDLAPAHAERVCVRDLPGNHPDKYPHIHKTLIEAATAGRTVVRLKGGDPLIFGRGGEEAEALRAAGLPYEIVPGVTAALAAGSYLEIPLTHRLYASAIALVTGHELPNKPGNKLDWKAIAAFPGTLAIYMGIARLPVIISELLKYGKPPDTPAAIVERASTGDQRSVYATLGGLEEARRHAGLEAPGLILVGEAVAHRSDHPWFGSRPLFGVRVLVTRPAHQAGGMVRKLEHLGAVVYRMPAVEIRDLPDPGPLDRALGQLRDRQWDWLVFTSANGVHALLRRLDAIGRDLRDLGGVKLAAIGPKTAAALREYHLRADVVPDETYSSEGLVEALKPHVAGARVLLARANRGRELLRDELARVATVEQVAVYEQADVAAPNTAVLDALRRGEIRYVTLPSSNIARGVLGAFDDTIRGRVERGEIGLVAISPETGSAVRALGYPVAAEAATYTEDGLIRAVVDLTRRG